MHEEFSYINQESNVIHVLLDKNEIWCYMLNEDTLETKTTSLEFGIYNILDIVEEEISAFWDIDREVLISILVMIEHEELEEDYSRLYKILQEEELK